VTEHLGFMRGSQKEMLLNSVLKFLLYGNNHCHIEVLESSHLFSSNCTILPNRWPITVDYEMADINMFLKK
jgi:hypothetical protein